LEVGRQREFEDRAPTNSRCHVYINTRTVWTHNTHKQKKERRIWGVEKHEAVIAEGNTANTNEQVGRHHLLLVEKANSIARFASLLPVNNLGPLH
jgi:hypothetical protein